PFPSERCKRPFPNPAVPFVSRWFLFTQKNYDFESRANAVIATVRAGSSLADIASRESFVGIAVAYPSVRSRILPRPRVERLSSGSANGRPEAFSVVAAVRGRCEFPHHPTNKKEK